MLAADGTSWAVALRYLAGAPSGPPRVPTALRKTTLAWTDLGDHEHRPDITPEAHRAERDRLWARSQKGKACIDKRLEARNPQYVVIRRNGA